MFHNYSVIAEISIAAICYDVNNVRHFLDVPVPAILNEAVPATTQNVDAEIQQTLRLAHKYTGMCCVA